MTAYMLDYAYKIRIHSIMYDNTGQIMFTNIFPDKYPYYLLYHDENGKALSKNKVDILSASSYNSFFDNDPKVNIYFKRNDKKWFDI